MNTADARAAEDLGGLPGGVRDAISRRLARLSEGCNRALSLAAVVGREFTLPVLTALSDVPEDRLLDILDEAFAARLVHDVPGAPDRYAFTHALVRDTLYEGLTPARRSRLHHQVAEALDRLAPAGDRPLADLAHHYAHGATADDAQKAVGGTRRRNGRDRRQRSANAAEIRGARPVDAGAGEKGDRRHRAGAP